MMNAQVRAFVVSHVAERMVSEPETPLRQIMGEVLAVAYVLYGTDADDAPDARGTLGE